MIGLLIGQSMAFFLDLVMKGYNNATYNNANVIGESWLRKAMYLLSDSDYWYTLMPRTNDVLMMHTLMWTIMYSFHSVGKSMLLPVMLFQTVLKRMFNYFAVYSDICNN